MYVSFSSLGLSICKFDDTLNGSHSVPTCFCPFLEGNKENIRHSNYLHKAPSLKREPIELNYYDALQILIFGFGVVTLLWSTYINLCTHSTFVSFNTDLNLYNKKKPASSTQCFWILYVVMFGLFLSECETVIVLIIFSTNTEFGITFVFLLKFRKTISRIIFGTLLIHIFTIAKTPATCILCLVVFQIWCSVCTKNVPNWLSLILILLSNDIHLNPGPQYQNNFFNFMSWNVNSIAKDDFQRVRLIEAHNSIFNYDLISICETSLNDSVELPETLLNDYTFVSANNPANTRHGGVGLFYKDSLPVIIRNDLSFDESIVVELKFGRKKIFFTVLYRSPAFSHSSPEFQAFISNFETLYSNIQSENPFATFFTGDFNAHTQSWWLSGKTTPEGEEIDELFAKLGLSQIISEPTNFEPHKNPSCIDLIVTDQPNIILESDTRASLDSYCHHQIIHCKLNFRIPPPLPFERKIWHFHRANSAAIKRCMTSFPWRLYLSINTDPNWQVKTFTDIFLNIMSNFIPNEIKRFVPRDPPWITKALKTMLNKKNKLFKNYKRHGYKIEDKVRLDTFRIGCQQAVESAKLAYLTNLGNKVNDPNTSQKSYWKIINRVMNKCRAPKIPPLLVNNIFILNCREKAKYINNFFAKQCKPVINSSVLPTLRFLTNERVDHIPMENDDITSLIRQINPKKATGSDGISGQMLLICDDSVTLPLQIIFSNILSTSIYPDLWKLANVTPIFKKGDKQLIKNYRPISLLPICGKILEKIIFSNLYNYLHLNGLITKNQSGFRPGDSTTNQLLYLVDEIHQAFDSTEALEVRAVIWKLPR